MEIKELRLFDRSRTTTDWNCPRKRYWNYEYDNRGLVTGNVAFNLYMGTILHDGLAAIAHSYNGTAALTIDEIASAAGKQMFDTLMEQSAGEDEFTSKQFAMEQSTLVEGLLRGFYKHAWPRLIEQYPKVLFIEQEMLYEYEGLGFMSKPDLILANDETSVYVEFKSTSSKQESWINSWATAVQLHSSIRAVEADCNIKVDQVIVQGLYKGYKSYGKQNSPFVYAYHRNGTPPFSKNETIYEYRSGFKKYPVWEMEGGIKAWVEGMPEEMLAEQFIQSPPIFIKDDMIDTFFKQRAMREKEIEMALQLMKMADEDGKKNVLDGAFPQHFDQCVPSWGDACAYRQLCFGHVYDPLTAGYEYRESHHQLEIDQQQQLKVATDAQ